MKKAVGVSICLALLLVFVSAGSAQENPPGPPPVLQIFREFIKPGMGAAHAKYEVGWPQTFRQHKSPNHYLAISSLSGPSEAWYLEGHQSFAEIEKLNNDTENNAALQAALDRLAEGDGKYVDSSRTILAVFRPDLSYGPSVNLPTMRYFNVEIFRVRMGHEDDFVKATKIVSDAHRKAGINEHWATYQVLSGMQQGTYIVFQPMKSMGDLDEVPTTHGKTFEDALGDNRKALDELTSAGLVSMESMLFSFSPKMSYPTDQFIAGDPGFWKPKAAAMMKPATKKEATKSAGSN